jgi:hypothetical protein
MIQQFKVQGSGFKVRRSGFEGFRVHGSELLNA